MNKAMPAGEPALAFPTILVVEDEPLLRMAICNALQDAGFRIFDVDDGLGALTVLRNQPSIALVFADIDLPGGISGVALGHLVRRDYPATKILLTSGRSPTTDSNFSFLPKPYYFTEVRRHIDQLLAL